MTIFKRYPHVRVLIFHYANSLNDGAVLDLLEKGVTTEYQAIILANFI